MNAPRWLLVWFILLSGSTVQLFAASWPPAQPTTADLALEKYFRTETARLSGNCLNDLKTLDEWQSRRPKLRAELFEMLSLKPLPPRGDLRAVITGRVEHELCTVEKLHFQSLPGLYVTANLYLPKNLSQPAPTILYLSGHGPVISNGVSYGNKVSYQHHGAWFAQHGYICLILDTLQLGEIQGLHHGTYREGMWWWNSRGYTPAGVEAWNSIRALDYLSTRREADTNRFGVTGRSGGGAYSWTLTALDERVKVAAPVAGITDLENYVVDGAVEGHCDCMFFVNTYRWDYPMLAALAAPRPLLFVNTDADSIFPLDGVVRTHAKLRRLYELHGAADKLGLVIGPGPHKDTQDLQVPVFRWFNHHLKHEDPVIEVTATKLFTPQQLKVFEQLPADAINTNIQRQFVATAPPPDAQADWAKQRERWMNALTNEVFRGWPQEPGPVAIKSRFDVTRMGVRLRGLEFMSQENVRLRLLVAQAVELPAPEHTVLTVVSEVRRAQPDDPLLENLRGAFGREIGEELGSLLPPLVRGGYDEWRRGLQLSKTAQVFFAPRGLGADAWSGDERAQTHIRRRFMLLGQTLEGMRVWDVRRAAQTCRKIDGLSGATLSFRASGQASSATLFSSLFEPGLRRVELNNLPASLRDGPDFLNVLRFLDLSQVLALAANHAEVRVDGN